MSALDEPILNNIHTLPTIYVTPGWADCGVQVARSWSAKLVAALPPPSTPRVATSTDCADRNQADFYLLTTASDSRQDFAFDLPRKIY